MSRLSRDSRFTGQTINPGVMRQLSSSLNLGEAYKDLAGEIKRRNSTECRFSSDDVGNFALNRNPSQTLLEAWMTQAPSIDEVVSILDKAGLIRQANLIREHLLGEPPLVPGPDSMPDPHSQPTAPIITIIEEFKEPSDGPIEYNYDTLYAWTDGFNEKPLSNGGRLIGEGGFAKVFLGNPTCRASPELAIKKLYNSKQDSSNEKQFHTEISILSKENHENILGLAGYCTSPTCRCIVYPYMKNGSLDTCLCEVGKKILLTPQRRTLIAAGSAEGICHLHSLGLVHRDLKSANLLLDENFVVKIGDCGLVQLVTGFSPSKTHTLATSVIGTPIYMPPEYIQYGEVSVKLDAYSYGVILLELITGLPAIDEFREEIGLPEFVDEKLESDGTLSTSVIDQTAGDWPTSVIERLFRFSKSFLEVKKKVRVAVSDVRLEICGLCETFS